jgi:DNA-binding NarL/FixJ family response regulator
MRPRCLIVDDNAQFLQASRLLLERQGLTVVDAVSAADQCLQRTAELGPDIVLVDVELGDESGFELAQQLARAGREAPQVIFISTHTEQDYADVVRNSGALGFLSKSRLSREAIERLWRSRPPSRITQDPASA